jgi:hypothetical protein
LNTNFRGWLDSHFKHPVTLSRLSNAKRVEKYYGDLDEHYAKDRMNYVLTHLRYSRDDLKRGKPNPSKIPFSEGANVLTGINTLRQATKLYAQFRDDSLQCSSKSVDRDATTYAAMEAQLTGLLELHLSGIQKLLSRIETIVEELRHDRDKWRSSAEKLELLLSNRQIKSPWRWLVK